jgi:hypothetical protein
MLRFYVEGKTNGATETDTARYHAGAERHMRRAGFACLHDEYQVEKAKSALMLVEISAMLLMIFDRRLYLQRGHEHAGLVDGANLQFRRIFPDARRA